MSETVTIQERRRHPASVAFDAFRQTEAHLFDGTTYGQYLENRLREAFQDGWLACERAVRSALEVQ